jgi:hypothetical protein
MRGHVPRSPCPSRGGSLAQPAFQRAGDPRMSLPFLQGVFLQQCRLRPQAWHFLVTPAPLEPHARQLPPSGQIKAAALRASSLRAAPGIYGRHWWPGPPPVPPGPPHEKDSQVSISALTAGADRRISRDNSCRSASYLATKR